MVLHRKLANGGIGDGQGQGRTTTTMREGSGHSERRSGTEGGKVIYVIPYQ